MLVKRNDMNCVSTSHNS